MRETTDIAIVGAGPYGLSLAAHLAARGAAFRIFGTPLSTWRSRMPQGMFLKSDGFASCLSAPDEGATLRAYCAEQGIAYHDTLRPVALDTFVGYGLAFQQRYAPGVEAVDVAQLAPGDGGFRLTLADGQTLAARRVVLAVGITHFDSLPPEFVGLPSELVTHASAHHRFDRFAGRDVTVIGGGSSAVEVAVGLAEAGARARLVARREALRFGSKSLGGRRSLWARLRHPSSGLGPGLRSRLACDAPDLFRLLPAAARLEIVRRHLGPSSAGPLKARLEAAEVLTGRAIASVTRTGGKLRLSLLAADGRTTDVETDHVICATGYRADVARLGFLDPALRARLRTVDGAPVLNGAFESSVPGLHFTGLAAAASFGPLMRFMFGDAFTARRLTARLTRR